MPDPTPKWLTEAAAAERLDVTAEDLRAMRGKGEGPAYAKRGPLVRYNVEALDAWVSAMFEDADPDNSEGWEVVQPETPVDVKNLYAGNPLAPKIPPATREGPSGIVDPQGNPVAAKVEQTGVPYGRGEYDFINDYGQEMHAPDPYAGMEGDQIAGVKPTPQVVEKASMIGGTNPEVVAPLFKLARATAKTSEMGGSIRRLAAPALPRQPGT